VCGCVSSMCVCLMCVLCVSCVLCVGGERGVHACLILLLLSQTLMLNLMQCVKTRARKCG